MNGRKLAGVALGVAVSASLLLFAAGCSSGAPSSSTGGASSSGGATTGGAPSTTTIVEKNFQFAPSTLTVKVGDVVTFSNQDSAAHHVVVGTADLGVQDPGKDVTWTADKDGVFTVQCTIHPSMTGQITVGAGGSTTPPSGTSGGSAAPPAGGTGGGSSAPPAGGYNY